MIDIMQCGCCSKQSKVTYHYESRGSCPECGAGIYWQGFLLEEEITEQVLQEARNQYALREFHHALKICDEKTVVSMFQILERKTHELRTTCPRQ